MDRSQTQENFIGIRTKSNGLFIKIIIQKSQVASGTTLPGNVAVVSRVLGQKQHLLLYPLVAMFVAVQLTGGDGIRPVIIAEQFTYQYLFQSFSNWIDIYIIDFIPNEICYWGYFVLYVVKPCKLTNLPLGHVLVARGPLIALAYRKVILTWYINTATHTHL